MFSEIDWCEGEWCPIPRPVLTEEDRAIIEGYGLECTTPEDAWTGMPEFIGWLSAKGENVRLACRLCAYEGEFSYLWRLRPTHGAFLDGLPNPLIVDGLDPVAVLAEAALTDR